MLVECEGRWDWAMLVLAEEGLRVGDWVVYVRVHHGGILRGRFRSSHREACRWIDGARAESQELGVCLNDRGLGF